MKLYSVREAAVYLRVCHQRVRQLIYQSRIAATRVSGRWVITEEALRRFAKTRRPRV